MTAKIIDGKKIAAAIRHDIKIAITEWCHNGYDSPEVAIIKIGNDPASEIYFQAKK